MMKRDAEREEMYDQMHKFMQDINVGPVRQAKKGPIIVGQHYGLNDFSGFQSMQGFPHAGSSSISTQANTSFFEGAQATHSYGHNMATLTWQTSMSSHPSTSKWQTQMPSRSANPNWQTLMPSHLGASNWQTLIPSHPHDAGLFNSNKGKNTNVSPLNLGNAFADDNVGEDDVKIMDECETGNYFVYENVNPSKVRREDYIDCTEFLLNPDDVI
nr:hypothetical protein [Tanacetum cinerariifolium]